MDNKKNINTIKNGVVILNYNSKIQTLALVRQISKFDSVHKICVVNNDPNEDLNFSELDCKIHYIKNENNFGYNAGNNIGLKYLILED